MGSVSFKAFASRHPTTSNREFPHIHLGDRCGFPVSARSSLKTRTARERNT
jgi:hypothetical protein